MKKVYIHLGENTVINDREIIGIFDVENTTVSKITRDYLAKNEKKKNVYLSVGKNDFIIGASKDFDQFLIDNEIGFSYRYLENKDHSWKTWREEIYNVFDYLSENGFIGKKPKSK